MRLRFLLALTALASCAALWVGVSPSSAAQKTCPSIPSSDITALKQTKTTCKDARAVAVAWNTACESISLEYFCDPKGLEQRKEPPTIKAKGYSCTATELSRTGESARHSITCKKGAKKVTFKHLATRAS